ncbi:macrophage mannose receptor 1-like [Palaemon carinicauda]|uniref:macrophage mannose receptor 1-like n=1 Tax=Palaemon carinicauda TaxID=392227 RepID=UPI0035B69801
MWLTIRSILSLAAAQFLLPSSTAVSDLAGREDQPNVSCPVPFQMIGDQCVFFSFMAPTDYQHAKKFCESVTGTLLTIKSAAQFELIINHIYEQGYLNSYWVDGSDAELEDDWRFSNNESVPMHTPFWLTSESHFTPDNDGGNENCIAIESTYDYFMNDVSCSEDHYGLCEYPLNLAVSDEVKASVECPPFYVDVNGNCLAFVTWEELTWEEASIPCIGIEGELAILNGIQQLRDIYEYLQEHDISEHSFWIGGSQAEGEGDWMWNDDTAIPKGSPWWGFSSNGTDNWKPEPDGGEEENCVGLSAEGFHYLRDVNCDERFSPLCMVKRTVAVAP